MMQRTNTAPTLAQPGRYLTFLLGNQEYAIPVQFVREIVGVLPITRVPGMPSDVLGVMNLRGRVVPTIDLRSRMGAAANDTGPRACVLVLEIDKHTAVGALVDTVCEVVLVNANELRPAPGEDAINAGVSGLAQGRAGVRILLDVTLALGDLASAANAAA